MPTATLSQKARPEMFSKASVPSFCKWVVASPLFERVIIGCILFAAVLVGIETYPDLASRYHGVLVSLDRIILTIFVVEAIAKMMQHGRYFYRYFLDPWNCFDFAIVFVCFLPINASYASVLRLARILRTLRLMTVLPQLQLIVGALIRSIPSMGYVGVLMLLFFYVFGVTGVFLFRENDPVHFCDLPRSILTLFRVVTLEDWTDVMYINMFGSDTYDGYSTAWTEATGVERVSTAMPIVGCLYFVSFVMFGTMIMLNLFVGVIINSMDEAKAEKLEENRRERLEEGHSFSPTDEIDQLSADLASLQERLVKIRRGMAV